MIRLCILICFMACCLGDNDISSDPPPVPLRKCSIKPRCRQTCAVPNPKNCPAVEPVSSNFNSCQCIDGYILSEPEGQCIKIEECPTQTSCNGDRNAIVTACPWACPPTCANPEAAKCTKKCKPVGCNCKSGYILSKKNGKCILPKKCRCGNPCGRNETFVDCGFRCPNQYCPTEHVYACKPPRNCPPGCGSPVQCSNPNEVWTKCSSDCLAERCSNVNDPPTVCDTQYCRPRCICVEGFYRDSSDICIPASQCPEYIPRPCTPTCAVPNPQNCDIVSTSCESGYVLSDVNGTCIKIEDCPTNVSCNGDENAVVKQCPAPCPSTCSSPNAFPCRRRCLDIGCECKPGYLFNDEGKCVLPDQCPGGNPCGEGGLFAPCKASCPSDYCPTSDSRAVVACAPPYPCYSGCVCDFNYRRKSYEDDQCIVASDCPPVNCTRPHEKWSSCPSACLNEYCDAVDKPPVQCYPLVLNCQPSCVCTKNHFRNASDICVSAATCRKINRKRNV